VQLENWQLIDYLVGQKRQLELLSQVLTEGERAERLVICHHPPVVTLGRASQQEDLAGWSGDIYQVSRGGRATYHGPSQVVAYPILDLRIRGNDIYRYLRQLEGAVVDTLAYFQVEAYGDEKSTGVWVNNRKIASIGIAVKKWITYHGVAISIYQDEMAFGGIRPCGMDPNVMLSLEELLDYRVERSHFEQQLVKNLFTRLAPSVLE
jgi:lipoyl(octanoyl) transferase